VAVVGMLLGGFGATGAWGQMGDAVKLHGFGGWAMGYTSNDNRFARIASNEPDFGNYSLALNVTARATETITLHSQARWQNDAVGQQIKVDHLFVNWKVSSAYALRAGKIKNPLGVYTDIFDVGTLRPFYLLPQGLYHDVPEGYDGLGLNGRHRTSGWELGYDVIGGLMEFKPSFEDMPVGVDPQTNAPVFATVSTLSEGRDFFGGGVIVRPPIEGLELGVSAYSLKVWTSVAGSPMVLTSDDRVNVYAGSGEYLTERTSLRAEGMRVTGSSKFDAFFVEAAYKLTEHWQVAATFDWRDRDEPPAIVEQLGDHRSVGGAVNYWASPDVVFKLNYYHVTGNRLARPADAVTPALAGTLEDTTEVVIFGTQFSF